MKCKFVIGPTFALEKPVRSDLPLRPPPDSFERAKNASALVDGQLLTENMKGNV